MINNFRSTVLVKVRRVLIGVVGGIVLIAGIVMIPYPGPGWVTVFVGLAILSQEFPWARRLLKFAKGKYYQWEVWVKLQSPLIKVGLFAFTTMVVIVTIWLFNGYGLMNSWFHLGQDWLRSPFLR